METWPTAAEPIHNWNRLQTGATNYIFKLREEEEIQFGSSPPWSPNKLPWRNFTPCFGKLVQNNFESFSVTVTKNSILLEGLLLVFHSRFQHFKAQLNILSKSSQELQVTRPLNSRLDYVCETFLPLDRCINPMAWWVSVAVLTVELFTGTRVSSGHASWSLLWTCVWGWRCRPPRGKAGRRRGRLPRGTTSSSAPVACPPAVWSPAPHCGMQREEGGRETCVNFHRDFTPSLLPSSHASALLIPWD